MFSSFGNRDTERWLIDTVSASFDPTISSELLRPTYHFTSNCDEVASFHTTDYDLDVDVRLIR